MSVFTTAGGNRKKEVRTGSASTRTDGPRNHSLPRHQVVVQPFQATVQGVRDATLVVVQGGVDGLRPEWTPRRLLEEESGSKRG